MCRGTEDISFTSAGAVLAGVCPSPVHPFALLSSSFAFACVRLFSVFVAFCVSIVHVYACIKIYIHTLVCALLLGVFEGIDRLGWTESDVAAGLKLVEEKQGDAVRAHPFLAKHHSCDINWLIGWICSHQGYPPGRPLTSYDADILQAALHFFKYAHSTFGWLLEVMTVC